MLAREEEKKERIETVVLSTTAKAKAKAIMKQKSMESQGDGAGDVEMTDTADSKSGEVDDASAGETKKQGDGSKVDKDDSGETKGEKKEEAPEPKYFALQNPCRVTFAQQRFLKYDDGNRYRPVHDKKKRNLGVIVLTDTTPQEEDD